MKLTNKEFEHFNNSLIEKIRSKPRRKMYNLPEKIRKALLELKKLIREKIIDIRKVDKGQMIVVIDFEQRKLIEQENIELISERCRVQKSNWEANRKYVDEKMKDLFNQQFIDKKELAAVTGILAGGVNGELKAPGTNNIIFTRAIDSNELFAEQKPAYVYPLLKIHKLTMDEILQVQPNEVHLKIPGRLVIGMSCCQLTRLQSWLEHFLTPLAKQFGLFEYTKDTTSILCNIEKLNDKVNSEHWDLSKMTLFSIDVKALYPSIKFQHLRKALTVCFEKWTNWTQVTIFNLIDIIMYTMENQQIIWNGEYRLLNQGIVTGAKHSVPLANILLSFIMLELIETDTVFKNIFYNNLKLWNRFIDDCVGAFLGRQKLFRTFFSKLSNQFAKYDLQITNEVSTSSIVVLDIEIYKFQNKLHTREHRKETATTSYLKFGSAHPKYIYKGILRSQMIRLRRICSRDCDFENALKGLRQRCLNSGYDKNIVNEMMNTSKDLVRHLNPTQNPPTRNKCVIRWVTLSNGNFENEISKFVNKLNTKLTSQNILIENVKTTGPSLSKLLFNNNGNEKISAMCGNCNICIDDRRGDTKLVKSSIRSVDYKIDHKLGCKRSGIYCVTCNCQEQYTGKTTIPYTKRFSEHFKKDGGSAVFGHSVRCNEGKSMGDYTIQFLEDVWSRGKYTLSEREHLWDHRIKGSMNIQKILKTS